jgi:hypothetical protein
MSRTTAQAIESPSKTPGRPAQYSLRLESPNARKRARSLFDSMESTQDASSTPKDVSRSGKRMPQGSDSSTPGQNGE